MSASATAVPATASTGLSKGGTVAIAVVVPIAVIVLLAILAFFFWRRNRDKKARLAARKGEIEDYGFDPNAPDGLGGAGPSSSAAGMGAGAIAGGAIAGGATNEMRQTSYGDDDGTGYRGWGPTSNSKRPVWAPGGVSADPGTAAAAAAVGAGAGAAYYGHQQGNSAGGYDPYPNQNDEEYYYPADTAEHQDGAPPNIPPKSYERYEPAMEGAYTGAPSTEYHQEDSAPLGVVNADVHRQASNASSRYSTISTDEQAGRSYENSPRFPQTQAFQESSPTGGGRPGRSTMGGGVSGYADDEGQGGRYDAVNF